MSEMSNPELAAFCAWRLPRQLRLDVWLDAFHRARERLIREWISDVATGRAGNPEVIDHKAREMANRAALYDGLPSWDKMRQLIYERDNGVCWACGDHVPWELYDLGHIVDRVCGGLDVPENLAVMCRACNQFKPLHETREEAERWRREDKGKKGVYEAAVRHALSALPPEVLEALIQEFPQRMGGERQDVRRCG